MSSDEEEGQPKTQQPKDIVGVYYSYDATTNKSKCVVSNCTKTFTVSLFITFD